MKAESFFNILRKDVEGKRVISFDCQKNLILPKLPDQSSYYLRQLYLYNFTVYEGLSTDSQTKCNTFCYTWLEREYAKGACQIASAIYHRLSETDLEDVHTVKLMSDGFGGQNKISTMVGMLGTWLERRGATGATVQGEQAYNIDVGVGRPICKRGHTWVNTKLLEIPRGVLVKKEKIKDVTTLQKNHYGSD